MELLPPTTFASSVACAKDSLKNISEIIGKYLGDDVAKEFMASCQNIDFEKANDILDRTVKELTGFSTVSFGLSSFANKFSQIPQLIEKVASAWSESDKVRAINSYKDKIETLIDRK